MVISIVLGVIGIGIATMGMKCTHCGDDNKTTKARIAMTGGIVFLVAGEFPPLLLPSLLPNRLEWN